MLKEHQTIREQLSVTPEEFTEMGRIGAMYYQQGNLEKARTIFEGLVELDPDNADAHSAIGALLTFQQKDDEAIKHLKAAIALNPEQIAPFVNLGEIYIRRQKLEEAVGNLKKAIELDPHERDAGANRARAMILGIYQIIRQKEQEKDFDLESKEIN